MSRLMFIEVTPLSGRQIALYTARWRASAPVRKSETATGSRTRPQKTGCVGSSCATTRRAAGSHGRISRMRRLARRIDEKA